MNARVLFNGVSIKNWLFKLIATTAAAAVDEITRRRSSLYAEPHLSTLLLAQPNTHTPTHTVLYCITPLPGLSHARTDEQQGFSNPNWRCCQSVFAINALLSRPCERQWAERGKLWALNYFMTS